MTHGYVPVGGFLSASLALFSNRAHKDYEPWFSVAARLSDFGMEVLRAANPSTTDNRQLLAATLYGRVLSSFQSTYILVERGLIADARTIVRASAETAIVLTALVGDVSIADNLMDRHFWHRRKLLKSWLDDPQALAAMDAAQAKEFEDGIRTIDQEHPHIKGMRDPINLADLARKSGTLGIYNAVYRVASGDAAHTSLDALNRHVQSDDQAIIRGLKFTPDTEDLAATLSEAFLVLASAIFAATSLFSLTTLQPRLNELTDVWKNLGPPGEYQPKKS